MQSIADKWDAIYAEQQCSSDSAAYVLKQNLHLLSNCDKALDLACGLGGNSILLAEHGIMVDAWDVSPKAINKLSYFADLNKLSIQTKVRDIELNPPEQNIYDVVVVSYFLSRPILKTILASLKIDGILFYQTFTAEKSQQTGPNNPDYLLNKNELLKECCDMDILFYREEGLQGDINKGFRNEAMIVAKRTQRVTR